MKAHCRLDERGEDLLRSASLRLRLSARSYTKVLGIARTIADLAASKAIEPAYIAEAIQYRAIGAF